MARAIDAGAVKRRAWDIAEAWKDQGRDYEALLLESVVEQIVDTQPTLTPPNEPLTLEELRQMRGKPVWTVTTGFNGSGRWELVCDVDCEDALEMASCVDGFYDIEVNTYGSTWLAYRRPPEGEEET